MKLPALWLALAFAGGIAAEHHFNAPGGVWITAVAISISVGVLLLLIWKKLVIAAIAALAGWFALGGLAQHMQQRAVAPNDVARLISAGKIDTNEPLRWRGQLRNDPESLPWGWRYTIDLEDVEVGGQTLPASGGLRLTYYRGRNEDSPPELRAGDRIEALARARTPRNYLDPGAFDERGYLARQNIELLGTLRSEELIKRISTPRLSVTERLARVRGDLLARLDLLYAGRRDRIAVLRAMLLGDRNFVNSDIAESFQKTAAFHVLVVAGLHVGALAIFIFWLGRLARIPLLGTTILTLAVLAAYLGVVQDRPPILRAALMSAVFLLARLLFRRVALVNTVALSALILLAARPDELFDSSFQLSFLAAGTIAGLAVPWIERTSNPYRAALEHLGDVTRDPMHAPRAAQFRLDLRAAANTLSKSLPKRIASHADAFFTLPVRLGLRLWEIVLLSFCIQLGMVPLLALYFHRVSPSGPLSNIPAVLLTALIVPLGLLTLLASYLWAGLGALLAKIESMLVGWLLASIEWFSRLPRASWRIPGPPAWLLAVFILALACLAAIAWKTAEGNRERTQTTEIARSGRTSEWLAFGALIVLTILVAIYPFRPNLEKGKFEATVLDVGQGDSIFLAFPNGRTMLIDGGGAPGAERIGGYRSGIDVGEEVVSPYLWSRGLKTIDVVLLTHAHHDHIGGLHAVLDNFRVGQLWVGRDEDAPAYHELLAQAHARNVTIVHEMQGNSFHWGGIEGEVLWPADPTEAPSAANNDSVVLRLQDGAIHFLLSGDIEKEVEETLTSEHAPLAADFLKVPHHGSKSSSTDEFLADVSPRVAVISAGAENPYGHPSPEVLERYEEKGIRLLLTERDGAVTALTDGHTLFVRAFLPGGTN